MKNILATGLIMLLLFSFAKAQNFWVEAHAGPRFSTALRSDGTIWTWGTGVDGALGVGATKTFTDLPIQVGSDTNWIKVEAGGHHCVAMKSDNSIWAWGQGTRGALGVGDFTDRFTPVQVGTDTDWAFVTAGMAHTLAIKQDGTLWAWGYNSLGTLGIGTTENVNVPTQVGSDNDWTTASAGAFHSLVLKSDGTLWSCGDNTRSELGIPGVTMLLVLTQVGTATDWTQVSTGQSTSLCVRSDSSLWAWGWNALGQLGTGDNATRVIPQRVGWTDKWIRAEAGASFSFAINADRELFGTGFNVSGQLGIFNNSSQNSFTQVGLGQDWVLVAPAEASSFTGTVQGSHTLGIRDISNGICATGWNEHGQLGNGIPQPRNSFDCTTGFILSADPEKEEQQQGLSVFPNPTTGLLTLEMDQQQAGMYRYYLRNLAGQTLLSGTSQQSSTQLDLSGLAKGMYLLQVDADESLMQKRIVVQ